MRRWDESVTCSFVNIYLSHDCLWNPENDDYRQKIRRREAYRQIIAQFSAATNIKLTEFQVREKIRSLRSTYYLEVAKIKKLKRPTKLSWFGIFHKSIRNVSRKSKSFDHGEQGDDHYVSCESSKVWVSDDSTNESQKQWVPDDPISESQSTHSHDEESDMKLQDNDEESHSFVVTNNIILKSELPDTHESKEQVKNRYKTRKRKSTQQTPSKNIPEQSYRSNLYLNREYIDDEFDIYGKYIASQLREMGLQRALQVQLKIQNIVSEARIEAVKENS